MINSYKALSGRYLKQNKKRTILTIVGIIMSVALICSIGTFMTTMQNTFINQSKESGGDYHLCINGGISKEELNKISSNPEVDKVTVMKQKVADSKIKNNNITTFTGDKTIFDTMYVKLEEGNNPTKSDEIVLEKWILKYFDAKPTIGSKIDLTIGGENKTFTLVGIAKDNRISQYSSNARAYIVDDSVKNDLKDSMTLVKLSDDANKRSVIDEIKASVGKDKVRENSELLKWSGESNDKENNKALFMVGALVIGIVVLATVMVIYNAFHISIADRTRQFGQLRAMGTTRKQVISLVIREASIMTIIAVPIGLATGVLAVYILTFVFNKLTPYLELTTTVKPLVIIGSGIIGTISVYLSAILPARGAGKISPLVAISSANMISKEKIKKSKNNRISKYLKIDKVMAIKNVKRNKKRFYVTAISMAISVTIFIGFMSFYKYAMDIQGEMGENVKYSFAIKQNDIRAEIGVPNDLIKSITNINGVSEVYKQYKPIEFKVVTDENVIPQIVRESTTSYVNDTTLDGEKKKIVSADMNGFDENKIKELKPYLISGSLDNLKDNEIIVVKDEQIPGETPIISPLLDLKPGDEVKVDLSYYYKQENLSFDEIEAGKKPKIEENSKSSYKAADLTAFKVAAVIEKPKFYLGYAGDQKIILPTSNMEKAIANNKIAKEQMVVKALDIKVDDSTKIDAIDAELTKLMDNYPQYKVDNTQKLAEEAEKANMQIVILLSGFIGVITLISSINIVNTVSTNIIIRKRELSSLKAIGMTSKELRRMICLEGAMFGIYGGVIGCVLGSIISYSFAKAFSDLRTMAFVMPWRDMAISLIAVMVIGYISALLPMRKFAKSNIIEGIKQE